MASSGRLRSVRLLAATSPLATAGLAGWMVATALFPILLYVAMGNMVGKVPAAARYGLDSSAGHSLITALVVMGVVFVLMLVTGPLKVLLGSVIKVRLTFAMQGRLAAAVSGPTGIAHLEDAALLDRVALAQGTLMNYYPADAPIALASVLASQASGVMACLAVATFRWWVGLGLLVFWRVARRPLRRDLLNVVRSFGGEADVMRRAEYLRQLVTRPQAAKEMRVFGLGDWAVERFRVQWLEGISKVWKLMDRMSFTMARVGVGIVIVYGVACAAFADAMLSHELSLRTMATLLPLLMLTATAGAVNFDDVGLEFMAAALPQLESIERDLAAASVTSSGGGQVGKLPQREVRFEHVGFRYPGATQDVFADLDLTLPVGQSTAIVGANGAGKSTLVKLLARLHDPTTGRIAVDGINLRDLNAADWQRHVAVVFQDFTHYPLSIADNVGFGAVDHQGDREALTEAARRAGASVVVDGLPNGWDTLLSPEFAGGVDLSGGQWQRVALARALFAVDHGARILVLDEPTAWLDVRGEAEFFERFLEITRGLTTVVISHRFSTVRQADHIVVIDDGQVIERGTHTDLVRGGVYADAFRLQAARFVEDGRDAHDEEGG